MSSGSTPIALAISEAGRPPAAAGSDTLGAGQPPQGTGLRELRRLQHWAHPYRIPVGAGRDGRGLSWLRLAAGAPGGGQDDPARQAAEPAVEGAIPARGAAAV